MHFLRQNRLSPRVQSLAVTLFFSIMIGFAWFLFLYGPYSLYFTNVNWIYNAGGDAFQHQLGWEWFRQEPWQFPLGRIADYGYPFGTYVSYVDSIPLLAIPLKLISPLLKDHFQYWGIWELISITGQMLFGMLILGEFTSSIPKKVLGASLLVLSPPMIFRAFGHSSLSAHWIILAAIWFVILEYRHRLWRFSWLILFVATLLIQLYFLPMLMALYAVDLFFRSFHQTKKWLMLVDVLCILGSTLFVGYCTGLFSLSAGDLEAMGFGYYTWNLNGLMNPFQFSAILKGMQTGTTGQYEGFSYLGLGSIFVFVIGLILYLQKDYSPRHLFFLIPFGVISVALGAVSLSHQAFLNNQVLWNIHLPEPISSIFSSIRATGRFIWPVFYFLVLLGLVGLVRNMRYASPILVLALLLQVIDIQPLYAPKKMSGFMDYQPKMQTEFWTQAAKTNRHIVMLPASNAARPIYQPLAMYAMENHLTLNWGYFSRADYGAIRTYADQVWEDLKMNRADSQTIYVFWEPSWKDLAKDQLSDTMLTCQVDEVEVVLSKDNALTQTDFNFSDYCSKE